MSSSRLALVASLVLGAACAGGTPVEPDLPAPPAPSPTEPALPFLFGNTGVDDITAVLTDASGNVVVAGAFSGTVDFAPGTAVTTRASLGGTDAFVARYRPDGTLDVVTVIGGPGTERAYALALDATGQPVVGGELGAGWSCSGGTETRPVQGTTDLFVAKLGATGGCQWIVTAGGTGPDAVRAVAVDGAGTVHVTGNVSGAVDFDPGTGIALPVQAYAGGASDLFVARYTATGAFSSVGITGTAGDDRGTAIAADAAGATYFATTFTGIIDADLGAGTSLVTSQGDADVLLARYDGTTLAWAARLGGTATDSSTAALAIQGTSLVLGATTTGAFDADPGAGVVSVASVGGRDGLVARYATASGALVGTPLRFGGPGDDAVTQIAAIGDTLAVSGTYTGSVDLDPGSGTRVLQSSLNGTLTEAFLAVLDGGDALRFVVPVGGGTAATGTVLSRPVGLVRGSGGVFWSAVNLFGRVDADPGTGTVALVPLGAGDAGLLRFSAAGALQR